MIPKSSSWRVNLLLVVIKSGLVGKQMLCMEWDMSNSHSPDTYNHYHLSIDHNNAFTATYPFPSLKQTHCKGSLTRAGGGSVLVRPISISRLKCARLYMLMEIVERRMLHCAVACLVFHLIIKYRRHRKGLGVKLGHVGVYNRNYCSL